MNSICKKALALALVSLAAMSAFAQNAPHANTILADAQRRAEKGEKAIMVIFQASWCGWCKKMDKVLAQPEVSSILDKYMVFARLTVMEAPGMRSAENPGGKELLYANGGQKQGIPFFFITDSKGKFIVNSIRPPRKGERGGNIGCPYEPEEISYFMVMLERSIPKITNDELAVIRKGFESLSKSNEIADESGLTPLPSLLAAR
jgi:thioredoxin-related protein